MGVEGMEKTTPHKPDCEGKENTMARRCGKNRRGEHAKKGAFGTCRWT